MGESLPSQWGSVVVSNYLGLGPQVSPLAWGTQDAGTLGTLRTPCT